MVQVEVVKRSFTYKWFKVQETSIIFHTTQDNTINNQSYFYNLTKPKCTMSLRENSFQVSFRRTKLTGSNI